MTIPAPFAEATAEVLPAWIDNNGHMNVGYYLVAFDDATVPFFRWLGFTRELRERTGGSTFALEAHLTYAREVMAGDPLRFEARLLDFDHKRVHYYQEMFHARDGFLAATYESISSFVDMSTRRTAPIPAELAGRLAHILAEHRKLPRPWQVGHTIATRPAPGGR